MRTVVRWPKFLKAAREFPCVRCGADDGTIVARHYNGLYQHQYGKGRGIKVHDHLAAYLCVRCDSQLSEGVGDRKSIERDSEWKHWIALSQAAYLNRYKP